MRLSLGPGLGPDEIVARTVQELSEPDGEIVCVEVTEFLSLVPPVRPGKFLTVRRVERKTSIGLSVVYYYGRHPILASECREVDELARGCES